MPDDLKNFLDKVHDGITVFDFEGKQTPCIIIDDEKYDKILAKVAGQAFSVNTDLNIFQDGLGHVFVEVTLEFSIGGMVEKFLVDAKTDLQFFECLAETTMLVLSSKSSQDNVFVIQLPRPERAHDALEIIYEGLSMK